MAAASMPDGQHGTFTTADGCSLGYTLTQGSGRDGLPVVLIHSLALDRTIWDEVVPRLAPHASVLAYDCRGHGASGRMPGPYTPELFASDLAQLLDQLGWRQVVVAGCSMGGCVAQAFAGMHTDRTLGLGLIDTTAWYGPEAPKAWRNRADVGRTKGLGGLIDFQVTRWFGDRFRAERPQKVEAMKRVFLGNDLGCYVAACEMLGDADLRDYLPRLRMPASVIVGEEDYATPVSAATDLAEAMVDATLTVLPEARHITPVEAPDRIAAELVNLLDRCRVAMPEAAKRR